MKKLLLHTCCAPCLSGVHAPLIDEGFDVTGFFYNPNIQPENEFNSRVDAFKAYRTITKFNSFVSEKYDSRTFKTAVEEAGGDRCANCIRLRLEATARFASRNGFEYFSTTLLVSPYQKHDVIRVTGERLSRQLGIEFLYRDMRSFYKDSIIRSRELGLYRQKYCGCELSREERNEQACIASK